MQRVLAAYVAVVMLPFAGAAPLLHVHAGEGHGGHQGHAPAAHVHPHRHHHPHPAPAPAAHEAAEWEAAEPDGRELPVTLVALAPSAGPLLATGPVVMRHLAPAPVVTLVQAPLDQRAHAPPDWLAPTSRPPPRTIPA